MMCARRVLALLAAIALCMALGPGCKKSGSAADNEVERKTSAKKGDDSKKTEDTKGSTDPGPPPDFLWKGDGTEPIPDSFGPAGPSPLLLFGAMLQAGNAEIHGTETAGGMSMANPTSLDLRYERDDDIKADWVKLELPEGELQFFAGMAVYGTINWGLKGAAGTNYEAESAIYLTTIPFADVLEFYKEYEGKGNPWILKQVDPAAQAPLGGKRVWVFRSPDDRGVKEIFVAEVPSAGITQITLARTVTVSDDVLNGLLEFDPKSLVVDIPEPLPPPTDQKGAAKGAKGEVAEPGAKKATTDSSEPEEESSSGQAGGAE